MHALHVFLLVISFGGEPEHVKAICETYKECSDEGAALSAAYLEHEHRQPQDVSMRIIPGLILPESST